MGSGSSPREQDSQQNNTFNGHILPPEQERPSEPPPPYTPSDPSATISQPPAQPPRPGQQQQQQQSPWNRPVPVPPVPNNRPATSPYNQYPTYSASAPSQQKHRPGPTHGYPGSFAQASYSPGAGPSASSRPPPQNNNPNPNLPFRYPPGYWCHKCGNNGIKYKNGLTCQDCYGRFARQGQNVRNVQPMGGGYNPFGMFGSSSTTYYGGGAVPPRVVQPGDPSIGGALCGRCRGRGLVTEFLFEDTCPVCRGVGRLF